MSRLRLLTSPEDRETQKRQLLALIKFLTNWDGKPNLALMICVEILLTGPKSTQMDIIEVLFTYSVMKNCYLI